ncbi:MAG: DUF3662 domain-containing protein [Candidatus Eremiobacteraeota bacterium]|nr:DUF3662 domain-containing protein [Candidatus Eremiobacteraeota bacterium]
MEYLRKLEKSLEHLIEGRILDHFQDGIHPMEVAKKLASMMREEKRLILQKCYGPNHYVISLSGEDYHEFSRLMATFRGELVQFLAMEAEDLDLSFLGPLGVELHEEGSVKRGFVKLSCSYTSGESVKEGGASLQVIRAVLAVKEGFGKGKIYPLLASAVTLGRSEDNSIIISDPKVSSLHCRIELQGDEFVLKDMDSRNGVEINRKPATGAVLRDRDEIALGYSILQFFRLSTQSL